MNLEGACSSCEFLRCSSRWVSRGNLAKNLYFHKVGHVFLFSRVVRGLHSENASNKWEYNIHNNNNNNTAEAHYNDHIGTEGCSVKGILIKHL